MAFDPRGNTASKDTVQGFAGFNAEEPAAAAPPPAAPAPVTPTGPQEVNAAAYAPPSGDGLLYSPVDLSAPPPLATPAPQPASPAVVAANDPQFSPPSSAEMSFPEAGMGVTVPVPPAPQAQAATNQQAAAAPIDFPEGGIGVTVPAAPQPAGQQTATAAPAAPSVVSYGDHDITPGMANPTQVPSSQTVAQQQAQAQQNEAAKIREDMRLKIASSSLTSEQKDAALKAIDKASDDEILKAHQQSTQPGAQQAQAQGQQNTPLQNAISALSALGGEFAMVASILDFMTNEKNQKLLAEAVGVQYAQAAPAPATPTPAPAVAQAAAPQWNDPEITATTPPPPAAITQTAHAPDPRHEPDGKPAHHVPASAPASPAAPAAQAQAEVAHLAKLHPVQPTPASPAAPAAQAQAEVAHLAKLHPVQPAPASPAAPTAQAKAAEPAVAQPTPPPPTAITQTAQSPAAAKPEIAQVKKSPAPSVLTGAGDTSLASIGRAGSKEMQQYNTSLDHLRNTLSKGNATKEEIAEAVNNSKTAGIAMVNSMPAGSYKGASLNILKNDLKLIEEKSGVPTNYASMYNGPNGVQERPAAVSLRNHNHDGQTTVAAGSTCARDSGKEGQALAAKGCNTNGQNISGAEFGQLVPLQVAAGQGQQQQAGRS